MSVLMPPRFAPTARPSSRERAVCEPVGHYGDDYSGQNAEQPKSGPLQNDWRRVALVRQRVHHPPEQDLLIDENQGNHAARRNKRDTDPSLCAEQAKRPEIHAKH